MSGSVQSYDYVIVGAGPGGLQAGYYLHARGARYVILERGPAPGAFFMQYPRHRKLISINKVHTGFDDPEINLRWDWNSLLSDSGRRFTDYSNRYFPETDDFVRYLGDFAQEHRLNVRCGVSVQQVTRSGGRGAFSIALEPGETLTAAKLIIATGRSVPNVPDFPGVEYCEHYGDLSIDPGCYTGQRVLIVGKGNSGMETADNLIETTAAIHLISPNPVRMAWRTHYVGDLRAKNNEVLDTYLLKSQNTILDAEIEEIRRRPDGKLDVTFLYTHAENHRDTRTVDRAILCTGFLFDRSIFAQECLPETANDGRFPAVTSQWESVNVPDLFFAGALMHGRDYRKSFSGFIHGFRYNVRFQDRLFRLRDLGEPLPVERLPRDAECLLGVVIARMNRDSSLFQQPAFLCDLYLIGAASIEMLGSVPVDYVADTAQLSKGARIQVTMEYGKLAQHEDPFNVFRYPDDGTTSKFIHPVLRYFEDGRLCAEHHIAEDLENNWDAPTYRDPARDFLASLLTPADPAQAGAPVARAEERI